MNLEINIEAVLLCLPYARQKKPERPLFTS